MIAIIGSMTDSICAPLAGRLEREGIPVGRVDLDRCEDYKVREQNSGRQRFYSIAGPQLAGNRPVGAIFCRAPQASPGNKIPDRRRSESIAQLFRAVDAAVVPVLNRPAASFSNYSKAAQLSQLRASGFQIPKSLVTNDYSALSGFVTRLDGQSIVKGVSNVPTFVQAVDSRRLARAERTLESCPALFQEVVDGLDLRIHVVGDTVFGSAIVADDPVDYRKSLRRAGEQVASEGYSVPTEIARQCVDATARLGLVMSGLDFRLQLPNHYIAFELNPYPLYSFYEARDANPIEAEVSAYLTRKAGASRTSNFLV